MSDILIGSGLNWPEVLKNLAPSDPRVPRIGDIVWFWGAAASGLSDVRGQAVLTLQPNAAIVTKVLPDDEEQRLSVFFLLQRGEAGFLNYVPFSTTPKHAHWSWPDLTPLA